MGQAIEIIAYCSAVWVVFRSIKILRLQRRVLKINTSNHPFVTIIIPVRNEEKNISKLLKSLKRLDYPQYEIIVCDDNSTDKTVSIAKELHVSVIKSETKPSTWIGKSWACWQAAHQARGEVLLFTDADTIHERDSLKQAVAFMATTNSALISAPQYHRNELWWEPLLGPFYCLLNIGVHTRKESITNPFAIGQYLLIDRKVYFQIGGHKQIKSEVADDASLAKAVMRVGLTYKLYQGRRLYTVQMYDSFEGFINGWLRILRLGMKELKTSNLIAAIVPLLSLNIHNIIQPSPKSTSFVPVVIVIIAFAFLQRCYGRFSLIGIILFPFGVLMFLALSVNALLHKIVNAPITWKGRTYHQEAPSRSRKIHDRTNLKQRRGSIFGYSSFEDKSEV